MLQSNQDKKTETYIGNFTNQNIVIYGLWQSISFIV